MRNEELINQFNGEVQNLPTKAKLKGVLDFINSIIVDVESGEKDALDVFISFKTISEALDKAKKSIDNKAMAEALKYQNDTYNGFKVSVIQGRKTFDFKSIKEHTEKQTELKQIEDKYKSAFDGVQKGTVQIDGENWIDQNGELLPLPKLSYGKSFIKIEKQK